MPEKVTVNYLVMEDLMAMSEFHAPVDKILFLKKKEYCFDQRYAIM